MNKRRFEVVCPTCKQTMQIFGDSFVNQDMEPQYISYILDGSFFTRKCGFCFHMVQVVFPFVYDCPSKQTTIVLKAPQASIQMRKVYYVDTLTKLQEMVRIAQSSLLFQEVLQVQSELLKYTNTKFDAYENNHLYFNSDQGLICIPYNKSK